MKATMKSLMDLTLCSGCSTKVTPPAQFCTEGHMVCSECKPTFHKNCPTCTAPLSTETNETFNKMLAIIPSKCIECSEISTDMEDHDQWCELRSVGCGFLYCGWSGTVKDLFDTHVKTHKTLPLKSQVSLPYSGKKGMVLSLYYDLKNYLVFRDITYSSFGFDDYDGFEDDDQNDNIQRLYETFTVFPRKKPSMEDQISASIKMRSELHEMVWTTKIPLKFHYDDPVKQMISFPHEKVLHFLVKDKQGEGMLNYEMEISANFPFEETPVEI